jgi:hypothetical protein
MEVDLTASLAGAGQAVERASFPDGSRVLVTPYGGRVLGLFAPGDDENVLWVNPVLRSAAAAREFFASPRWQNIGGERTWIGPEVDFFFPGFPDLSVYRPPRPLDGSLFALARVDDLIRLSADFSAQSARARTPVDLRLTKAVGPAPNPLRHERAYSDLISLRYAGYSLRSTLEITKRPDDPVVVGIWNLTQLPHGGEMIIPTYGIPAPTLFFGQIPPGHLRLDRGLARYRMASAGEHKIGLRAPNITGRIGYLWRKPGQAHLVVKNIFGNASAEYPDVPSSGRWDTGFCVEACNVSNETLGTFSELEYHAPAIGAAESKSEDVSQLWAYRGEPGEIAAVAEMLLGLPRESAWA